ncbi:hypothetical protein G4B88_026086 [Cannabis sativa]|uniref:Uncharacterized protein n=1 Tax=Cannabis sativa TaxID=3483 RepID=A0A7J6DQG7_CANSA|nr:hypothetical protein G4B88_026086 [Cannabis sativa]
MNYSVLTKLNQTPSQNESKVSNPDEISKTKKKKKEFKPIICDDKISTTFSGLIPKKLMSTGASSVFGHPLGTALQLCLTRSKVVFMSIGTGMGAMAVLERGDSVDELSNI